MPPKSSKPATNQPSSIFPPADKSNKSDTTESAKKPVTFDDMLRERVPNRVKARDTAR